jgi:hypothetical protein
MDKKSDRVESLQCALKERGSSKNKTSDQTFRIVDTKDPISVQIALRTAILKLV